MYPDITRDDVFMLETRRLWLRWPRFADAQAIVRLAGDKRICDMMATLPHPMTAEAAESFVFNARKLNADGAGLVMAITGKSRPDALIGGISIRRHPDDGKAYLGYWVGQPSWGQGVATEAAEQMIDTFFLSTGEQSLEAIVQIENEASRNVVLKSGMEMTGSGLVPRPSHGDEIAVDFFSLSRSAWSARLPWLQPSSRQELAKAVAA